MEDKFPGYHKFKEEDFSRLWSECVFVFDTNVLLNLYRYKISTRGEMLKIFDTIDDRIWIPHQVALEFHDERLNVIDSLIAAYKKIGKLEKDNYDKIKKELENYKERHPIIDVERIIAVLDSNYESITRELDREKSTHPDWNSRDEIKDKIYALFAGKVGTPYSQKSLEDIYERGKKRYPLKIPPGYEDRNEKKQFPYKEYGDLVLWCQLMDESKRISKPMIFVTDDNKGDWWRDDRLPRPELIQEFFAETNNMFYIYSPKDFMKWTQEYLHVEIPEDAIKEIEEVKLGDEKYLGDKATRNYSITWAEVDPLPQSEYDRIYKISEIFKSEMDKNPEMTEEDANRMLLRIDSDIVNRHKLRVVFQRKNYDLFGHLRDSYPPENFMRYME